MLLRDVLSAIRFNTSTTDDLSGRTVQPLFSNKNIIIQLNFAMRKYASFTKALEDIWSTQVTVNSSTVPFNPPDILRSQGIRFAFVYNKGLRYPIIEQDLNNTYANFYVTGIKGIPGWFTYFANQINLYPTNSLDPLSTTLGSNMTAKANSLLLASDIALPTQNGRLTIDDTVNDTSEKIAYEYKSGLGLYNITRGVEGTTASEHPLSTSVTLTENNMHILYRKMHWEAVVYDDDRVDDVYADRTMDIPDEHMETIIDYVSYKLLLKIPSQMEIANAYRVDLDAWLKNAKYDIQKGRSEITKTAEVRDAYWYENDATPYRFF